MQSMGYKDKPHYQYLIKCLKDELKTIQTKTNFEEKTLVDKEVFTNDSLYTKFLDSL